MKNTKLDELEKVIVKVVKNKIGLKAPIPGFLKIAKKEYPPVELNGFVNKDEQCKKPNLLPGDIVTNKLGDEMVVTEAQVIVNGGPVMWNEELPDKVGHGGFPQYSCDFLGSHYHEDEWGQGKNAWWEMSEFGEIIELGILHRHRRTN